ncbi:putative calcium-binding mitochondrial carrier K02F3.2 [Toxocara canis]|uniref:Putative calcium-binding mitochondrial carrier K02F3.2 n=1 Tax=Toxocara canis TaxID=6265 RepID=A0A0B2W0Y0_TOXCA|nr:putative calcium-binding mitochondrial carrier K02F3.2 [Toxocara canis]
MAVTRERFSLSFDQTLNSKRRQQITSNLLGLNTLFGEVGQCTTSTNRWADIAPWRCACCELDYASARRAAVSRTRSDALLDVFNKYASVVKGGVRYMTADDFIRRYLGLYPADNYNKETIRLLASAADTTKDGFISFEEFSAFESILCSPDALYLTAFGLFDKNASESITCDEFEKIIRHTRPLVEMDFDFNSDFIKRYFGRDKKRALGYLAFCQLLHDFYEELGIQAFKKYDKNADGTISSVDFLKIMTTIKKHLLTDFVQKNLITVSGGNAAGHRVTYAFYTAFNSVLSQMELIKQIYVRNARGSLQHEMTREEFLNATQSYPQITPFEVTYAFYTAFNSVLSQMELIKQIYVRNARGSLQHEMTREEFLNATQSYPQITPFEVEILFNLAEAAHPGKKTLSLRDIEYIDPQRLKSISYTPRPTTVRAVKMKEERGVVAASYSPLSAADTTKDGFISFEEFSAFESILCSPDALYLTAFGLFDKNASESITCDEFEKIIRHTRPLVEMDFDFNSDFIKRYFGRDKKRALGYLAFCQLLHDFYEELGIQAFKKYDKNADGTISSVDFLKIMTTIKKHLLTDFVQKNLITVSGGNAAGHRVTYAFYTAFNSVLSQMELIKQIYVRNARGSLQHEMTREEFLNATQSYPQITPFEVEILFNLAEAAHPGKKTLSLRDIEYIDPQRLKSISYTPRPTTVRAVKTKEERGVVAAVLESAYRFTIGSIAGACGATAVYPIDLVKTRMQNQRSGPLIGEVAYKHSFDCFKKVIKFEGILGLYRGLLPQVVGVAPEKAIKLTVNDTVRDKFTVDGHIPLWAEILAGGCGGASQVIFTNPLEIVKIRLQVAGEVKNGPRVGVLSVLRDLGLLGLYKGAKACFLRDIPFSAIYFPVYANTKLATADSDGHNGPGSLFASAFIAGVPAAALVTPADVIKTRLQVAARAGQTTYDGLLDCARKVMREEGPRAFWKGTAARVCRSSPQFAVTLFAYELLQRIFYVDFGGIRPVGSEVPARKTLADESSSNPEHIGGYRLAGATFNGIEHKFGLFMPRFEAVSHAK